MDDKNTITSKLKSLFATIEQVEFAYLFGSAARDKTSPISDVDVAVYLNESSGVQSDWRFRIDLISKVMDRLRIDDVDLVYLNESPIVLSYEILKHGISLDCKNPEKRLEFVLTTIKKYCDTAFLREFHLHAAQERSKKGERRGSSPGFTKALDSIRGLFD